MYDESTNPSNGWDAPVPEPRTFAFKKRNEERWLGYVLAYCVKQVQEYGAIFNGCSADEIQVKRAAVPRAQRFNKNAVIDLR